MKRLVTFEVDSNALFDSVAKAGMEAIGQRLVGVLLSGQPSLGEAVGMGVYGIVHVETKPAPEEEANG